MAGRHHSRGAIEHGAEVVTALEFASPVAIPIRTGNSSARCAAVAASSAARGDAKTAHIPSPVCLKTLPAWTSIALRKVSLWVSSATRMASASASHRRVDPSMSVNKKVTTPDGAAVFNPHHPRA